jgi:hypothetical protein
MDTNLIGQWLRDFHLPAFFAALLSIAYFCAAAPGQTLLRRAAASAHGVTIAVLYLAAWLIYSTHHADGAWAAPFAASMFVPLGLMVMSPFIFRGNALVHLLLLPNVFCLVWVWLRGTVVITGFVF